MLLAALDKNVNYVGNYLNRRSDEFRLAREHADLREVERSSSPTRHIFELVKQLTDVKRDILLTPSTWENDSEHTLQTALMTW